MQSPRLTAVNEYHGQKDQPLPAPTSNMKTLEETISKRKIIEYVCRIRAKHANQRGRRHLVHLLTKDEKFNYHLNSKKNKRCVNADEELLNKILPSRRKWKKLNKSNRYNKNGQRISSVEYNFQSLMITIAYYRNNRPAEPFLKELDLFVQEIQNSINDEKYNISPPSIHPKPKDKDKKDGLYRPIASFNLKDRVIIRFVNKYYTALFDNYFCSSSFAFRASHDINHHDAIHKIHGYKIRFKRKHLWVAESDIRNFFDSVSHSVIKEHFEVLIQNAKKDYPEIYDQKAERIFYSYLDSYSFGVHVFPLNGNPDYWKKKNIIKGKFKWIEPELKKLHKTKYASTKIGIPQGGALSGLIANIVLNTADKYVHKSDDSKLLYVRFCDDMIILHPNKTKCLRAIHRYGKALKVLKLVPHTLKSLPTNDRRGFWNEKSKNPYKWALQSSDAFEWLGFVGYEIKYNGLLRVRSRSLKKELTKQKDVVNRVISAVQHGRRKSDKRILESATNRLIGMSVGRVKIWNYDKAANEMCWIKGFSKLVNKNNTYLSAQLKQLDRGRNKQICILKKALEKLPSVKTSDDTDSGNEEGRRRSIQNIKYGKPFSYYYQVLEKKPEPAPLPIQEKLVTVGVKGE